MSGLTPFTFKANSNTYVSLNLDRTIYDSDIAAAVGALTVDPPAGSTVFFLPQRLARRSNAIGRVLVTVKRGKKYRRVNLICDREKLPTIANALKDKKINLGLGTGVAWDVVSVSNP